MPETDLPSEIRSVQLSTIDHDRQRYETLGDYEFSQRANGAHLDVYVSRMKDWRFGFVCGIHEQVEAALLVTNGIPEPTVREFDEDYERARKSIRTADYRVKWGCECDITADTEPGEDPHAPYHREHMFADAIERLVLRELGGDWAAYEEAAGSLEYRPKHDPFRENGESSEDADDNAFA